MEKSLLIAGILLPVPLERFGVIDWVHLLHEQRRPELKDCAKRWIIWVKVARFTDFPNQVQVGNLSTQQQNMISFYGLIQNR